MLVLMGVSQGEAHEGHAHSPSPSSEHDPNHMGPSSPNAAADFSSNFFISLVFASLATIFFN